MNYITAKYLILRPFRRLAAKLGCLVRGRHRWSVGDSFHVGSKGFGEYDECMDCNAERLSVYRGNTNARATEEAAR